MDVIPIDFDLGAVGRELNIPIFSRQAHLETLAQEIRTGHAYCVQVGDQDLTAESGPANWKDHPEFVVGACLVIARSHMLPRRYRDWVKRTGLREWEASQYVRMLLETVGSAYLQSTASSKKQKAKARA